MIPKYKNHCHIHSLKSVICGDHFAWVYYKEEGGDFLPNLNHMHVVNPKQVYDPKLISFALIATWSVWFVYMTCSWDAYDYHIILKPSWIFYTPFFPIARN
jgi:hypothetical protein